jgi:hypothetical protein
MSGWSCLSFAWRSLHCFSYNEYLQSIYSHLTSEWLMQFAHTYIHKYIHTCSSLAGTVPCLRRVFTSLLPSSRLASCPLLTLRRTLITPLLLLSASSPRFKQRATYLLQMRQIFIRPQQRTAYICCKWGRNSLDLKLPADVCVI